MPDQPEQHRYPTSAAAISGLPTMGPPVLTLALTVPLSTEDITAALWRCVRHEWCSVAELTACPSRARSLLAQAFTLCGSGIVDEGDRDITNVEHAPATGPAAAELAADLAELRALVAAQFTPCAVEPTARPALVGAA